MTEMTETSTKPSLLRTFLKVSLIVAGSLIGVAIVAVVVRPEVMIFHPLPGAGHTPDERGWVYERVEIATPDGETLIGWYLPAQSVPARPEAEVGVVLYCHGNAGNIGGRLPALEGLIGLGQAVLIFDYRGFGESTGRPTVAGTRTDVQAAWDWLLARGYAPDRIVVWGHSLGGAIAIDQAARASEAGTPPAALVVEGSFTSAVELGKEMHPLLPVGWFAGRIEYPSRELIAKVDAPILIAHATDDELIGFHHGEALHEASGTPEPLIELSGGHNGGHLTQADLRPRVVEFLARALTRR
ncbi:alpha/beta hydrolase [Nannocystaceae bacterium ST9]